MPDVIANEDLLKGLKQARKQPRNFALIGTGSKPLKLVVQKKVVKPGEIVEYKKEAKGTLAITGVCQGEGSKMTFFVTEEPSFKLIALKELIAEETGLTVKPEFQVVNELPEVREGEDEENEGESEDADETPSAPVSEAPPAPPPPPVTEPPTSSTGVTGAQLLAALNKLTPAIQQAVAANPARKAELLKPVAEFQAKIKANELDAAKELLVTINRSLSAASSTPPPAPPPVTPPPQQPVTPPHSTTQPQDESKTNTQAEARYEKLLAGLESRYVEVLRGQPTNATQLRAVMAFAQEKAEAGDFAGGATALGKLSELLDVAQEEIEQRVADAFVDDEDEARGVVAFRKALLLWSAARDSVRADVERLQAAVLSVDQDADLSKLTEILDTYSTRLDDALIDCLNASDKDDRQFYHERARELIAEYQTTLASDQIVAKVDENPFVPVAINKTLSRALKQVASELK